MSVESIPNHTSYPRPPKEPITDERIAHAFTKMGLEGARRHLFLCPGPECCPRHEGLAAWETLKKACREPGADALRTKAECLRVCVGGPWLVVYPDGVWYGEATPERVERIVHEHVIGGRPVKEWITQMRPLSG